MSNPDVPAASAHGVVTQLGRRVQRLVRRIRGQQVCEESGCPNKAEMFELEECVSFHCYEHAQNAGFCWSCGGFYAGCWEFDMHPHGLCHECDHQLRADSGEFDEEEECA